MSASGLGCPPTADGAAWDEQSDADLGRATKSDLAALALVPGVGPYLVYAPIVIAACKLVTIVYPPPVARSRRLGVCKLVSVVALSFGYAANAIPAGLPPTVAQRVEAAAAVQGAAEVLAGVHEGKP